MPGSSRIIGSAAQIAFLEGLGCFAAYYLLSKTTLAKSAIDKSDVANSKNTSQGSVKIKEPRFFSQHTSATVKPYTPDPRLIEGLQKHNSASNYKPNTPQIRKYF